MICPIIPPDCPGPDRQGKVPIRGHCEDCGKEFEITGFVFRCRRCQGAKITLTSGEELYIDNLET